MVTAFASLPLSGGRMVYKAIAGWEVHMIETFEIPVHSSGPGQLAVSVPNFPACMIGM